MVLPVADVSTSLLFPVIFLSLVSSPFCFLTQRWGLRASRKVDTNVLGMSPSLSMLESKISSQQLRFKPFFSAAGASFVSGFSSDYLAGCEGWALHVLLVCVYTSSVMLWQKKKGEGGFLCSVCPKLNKKQAVLSERPIRNTHVHPPLNPLYWGRERGSRKCVGEWKHSIWGKTESNKAGEQQ